MSRVCSHDLRQDKFPNIVSKTIQVPRLILLILEIDRNHHYIKRPPVVPTYISSIAGFFAMAHKGI